MSTHDWRLEEIEILFVNKTTGLLVAKIIV
jgi:hypothetical protein